MKSRSKLISNAFLLGMHDAARNAFQNMAIERHYAPGDHLFDSGERGDCFFLICSGDVEECYTNRQMSRLSLGAGEVLGASCLAPPYRRLSTAIAQSEVDVLEFDGETARRLSESDNGFGCALFQRLFGVMVERLAETTGMANGWLDHDPTDEEPNTD